MSKGTLWVKKNNFWKFCFFSNSSDFWTNIHRAWRKFFGQGYQNWKLYSMSSEYHFEDKIFFLKVLVFFSNYSELWTNIYCAWRESFRQGYQNWKMQFSSQKIDQKIKLLKVLFIYQILQNFERTFTVLGEKVLGRDIKIENCTLCLQSINLRIKIIFWKFCKFSLYSDLEHNFFGFVATDFSRGLSKLHSTCLFEFFLRSWY